MKIADTNVLLYATNPSADQHEAARRWVSASLSGGGVVGFAWIVLVGFIRLSTSPIVLPDPMTPGEAVRWVDEWLARGEARVVHPTVRHLDVLGGLLEAVGAAANLTSDAHLAALAIEHHAEVVTFDRDFGRFPGVRWELPG